MNHRIAFLPRRTHRVWACLAALAVLSALVVADQPPAASRAPAEPSPLLDLHGSWRTGRSDALLAILDEHVEWVLRNSPVDASQRGDERYNTFLSDPSPAATERRVAEAKDRLKRLREIGVSKMAEVDRLDADLLGYELEQTIAAAKFHTEQLSIDAKSGPQVGLPQMCDSLPFTTARQYADYATRLEAIPEHLSRTIEQLRAGMAAGRVPPRVTLIGVPEQCSMLASADIKEIPSLSPFYKPFRGAPKELAEASAARARTAISERIIPAFRAFGDFIQNEYMPKCRESVGYSDGIDGRAAYDFALRRHTTTDLTADRIHDIGLAEVARVRAEMMTVIARTDFPRKDVLRGDTLFHAFVDYLRTDKRFYYNTPEELLTGYREICKRMDAELPRLFGKLPRLSYGVRELPPLVAPTAPTAYYYLGSMKAGVPGWFMANTYRLDQRPKYEMTALALHESVPGHHLQIALSQELEGQHPFHTFTNYTAFVEGWGLYSERLGMEVGDLDTSETSSAKGGAGGSSASDAGTPTRRTMYSDPYNDFGRLSYEMWRACRLVVDTGMHAKGWSRDKAIAYMADNTSLSQLNIEREVDRYIAWPGQACAYKIGQLKISELRARAEKTLGDRFSLRTFHDTVLGSGSIPLPALEAKVDRWIASQKPDSHH